MKVVVLKVLFFLLILNFGAPFRFAQSAETANQNTEVMGEDERLPFMQNEESARVQDSSSGSLLLRTLGAMLLIVGIIFFGAWGLKKFGFGNVKPNAVENAPELVILSSVSPGSGRTLSVVRFGERNLLIGSTAQSFTLLADDDGLPSASDMQSNVLPQARSVADLLAEEKSSFDKEFARAAASYDLQKDAGGKLA